jgi:hypothetical protein
MAAAARMTEALAQARDRGVISEFLMGSIDQNIQQLVNDYGSCERIRKTPLTFGLVPVAAVVADPAPHNESEAIATDATNASVLSSTRV